MRVLVIDDFHLAGAASADTLRWLVQYHPPSLQLIVASRVDPPLRVHRMRAHQDLVELRDGDLAFSVEETESLLAGFGVRLDESELALVHRRSEGWAALAGFPAACATLAFAVVTGMILGFSERSPIEPDQRPWRNRARSFTPA